MYSGHTGYPSATGTPFLVRDILSWSEQQNVAGLDYPPPLHYMSTASYQSPELSPRHCEQLTLLNPSVSSPTVSNGNGMVSNSAGGGVNNPACLYGTGGSPANFLQPSVPYSQHLPYSQSLGAALSVLHPTSPKDYDAPMIPDPTSLGTPAIPSHCLEEDALEKGQNWVSCPWQ